jgi:hypothetical protein
MAEVNPRRNAMKWFVTIISSLLLIFSTIIRAIDGQGADVTLCTVFVTISGLVWGANIADYFKKLK